MRQHTLTQAQVKVICKAFGFTAKYYRDYTEWKLTPTKTTDASQDDDAGYFTNDADDVIYTMLSQYRWYRQNRGINGMIPESITGRTRLN